MKTMNTTNENNTIEVGDTPLFLIDGVTDNNEILDILKKNGYNASIVRREVNGDLVKVHNDIIDPTKINPYVTIHAISSKSHELTTTSKKDLVFCFLVLDKKGAVMDAASIMLASPPDNVREKKGDEITFRFVSGSDPDTDTVENLYRLIKSSNDGDLKFVSVMMVEDEVNMNKGGFIDFSDTAYFDELTFYDSCGSKEVISLRNLYPSEDVSKMTSFLEFSVLEKMYDLSNDHTAIIVPTIYTGDKDTVHVRIYRDCNEYVTIEVYDTNTSDKLVLCVRVACPRFDHGFATTFGFDKIIRTHQFMVSIAHYLFNECKVSSLRYLYDVEEEVVPYILSNARMSFYDKYSNETNMIPWSYGV